MVYGLLEYNKNNIDKKHISELEHSSLSHRRKSNSIYIITTRTRVKTK